MFSKRKTKLINQLNEQFGSIKNEDFNFNIIEKYFKKKVNNNSLQIISDNICSDLDFDELFCYLDRTQTPVGQQYLYNKLRVIPREQRSNETLTALFSEDADFRLKIQIILEKINKSNSYYISSLFQEEHIPPPKWYWIIKLLSATSLLSIIFIWFNPQVFFLLLTVFITNMIIHYWNKRNVMQYTGAIPMLIKLNRVASELYQINELKPINPSLNTSINIINQIKRSMSFFRLDTAIKGEFEALYWFILELIKVTFLLEPLLLFGVLRKLNTKRNEIEAVFEFVGEIDTLISISSLRKQNSNYAIPEIKIDNRDLIMDSIYHPLIDSCVKNSIKLNNKSVLLTGSNMSGKTTFIRTVGINVLCAQTINTCFAKRMQLAPQLIHSAIRISDDLMNDKSYYFEEVLRIRELVNSEAEEHAQLFLLDELFKGTNTIERIAAGKAVLTALNKKRGFVFVSTHDIELADLLKDEYNLYHFSEVISDDQIDFDYLLKEGKLTMRNAIRILKINNYPKKIISEALEISKKMDEIAVS